MSGLFYSMWDFLPTSWNSQQRDPEEGNFFGEEEAGRGGCSAPEEFPLGFMGIFGMWALCTPQLIPILENPETSHPGVFPVKNPLFPILI